MASARQCYNSQPHDPPAGWRDSTGQGALPISKGLQVAALVFAALFLVVGSFAAGLFAAAYAPTLAPALAVPASPDPSQGSLESRLTVLREVARIMDSEYYDAAALRNQDLAYGAIRGLLQSLGDPYTNFANPKQAAVQNEDLSGKLEGIGAVLAVREGQLLVVEPEEDAPAQRAGLRPGDQIAQIDGKSTVGLTAGDAVGLIRGPRGSIVVLTIVRQGLSAPFDVAIVRAEVKLKYVRWEMLPDQVAYLQLTNFGDVSADFIKAVRDIRDRKPDALVLDLRGNPGGYLEVAVDVASQFLDSGPVLYQEERDGTRLAYDVKRGGLMKDLPLAVLVDKGSASASEIVAGALQDYHRAVLVGEVTTGKGSVQKVHALSDNSSLRVTYAHWLTPKGRQIDKRGLEPDLPVAPPAQAPLNHGEDAQLQSALSYLAERQLAGK